jgi:hypothetical protein
VLHFKLESALIAHAMKQSILGKTTLTAPIAGVVK